MLFFCFYVTLVSHLDVLNYGMNDAPNQIYNKRFRVSFSHYLPCAHLCEACCDLLKVCPFKEIVIKVNLRLFHLRREFFVNLKIAIDAETLSICPHTKKFIHYIRTQTKHDCVSTSDLSTSTFQSLQRCSVYDNPS